MKNVKLLFVICCLSAAFAGYTEQQLIEIRDGFDARRSSLLNSQIGSPYPGSNYPEDGQLGLYVWNRQNYALSALYQNVEIEQANQAVVDACNALIDADAFSGEFGFHWQGNLFYRIYKFFYAQSEHFPGRLTGEAEDAIREVMWLWAKTNSKITHTDFSENETWVYWESENHDAQAKTTAYSAADILRSSADYQDRVYDDDYTAAEHYQAWIAYFKEYFSQRARRGLMAEIGSFTYTKYTLQGWYNFYDFAPDAQLRELAGKILDLWWADWAVDQLESIRGGAKSRITQNSAVSPANDGTCAMAWYYLDVGLYRNRHPGIMCMATSFHRLPLVVMDLALDAAGKGSYEFYSRRPGLLAFPKDSENVIGIDSKTPGILRYTYHTPSYVLGSYFIEKRPRDEWTPISMQNRWVGAVFAGHENATIFPQCVGLGNENTWNQHWSIQSKGTLITQKIVPPLSHQAGDMRVYFSGSGTNMTISEQDGWVFARTADAFAAVRPAWGTYSWDDSNWIRFSHHLAPVIMEVWQSSDFDNVFTLFRHAVLNQSWEVENGVLTYTGLKDAGELTFYTESNNLPKINGEQINLDVDYTFKSPFLNSDWDSTQITISKDDRELILDFSYGEPIEPEYNIADINKDGIVDFRDFAIMAQNWLLCTIPDEPGCIIAE